MIKTNKKVLRLSNRFSICDSYFIKQIAAIVANLLAFLLLICGKAGLSTSKLL